MTSNASIAAGAAGPSQRCPRTAPRSHAYPTRSEAMRHLVIAAFPAVLVCALTACSDRPSPAEPASTAPPRAAMAQGQPTEVDETPFPVPFCGFPVEVVLSGKAKTIELPGGRMIITAPGLKVTLTNTANRNQETLNITGALH